MVSRGCIGRDLGVFLGESETMAMCALFGDNGVTGGNYGVQLIARVTQLVIEPVRVRGAQIIQWAC